MKGKSLLYKTIISLRPIIFHVLLGLVAYNFRGIMKVFVPLMILYFLRRIIWNADKNKEVLIACAYVMGSEVFFRMTHALVFYETSKYLIIVFLCIGMYYNSFKMKAYPYVLYLLLLLPGVLVSLDTLSYDVNFRTTVLFNLSGPLCLAVSAVYCYGKKIPLKKLLEILDYAVFPIIATAVYVQVYTPSQKEIFLNTESNFAASGGFGPNQVATVLGLGFFILFTRLIFTYKNKVKHYVMMFFMVFIIYRGLLTFSRGGIFTSIGMIALFIGILYVVSSVKISKRIALRVMGIITASIVLWVFVSNQTGGLIENRYTNKNMLGQEKEDITTGRKKLLEVEFDAFQESPILGIGVGKSKSYHYEELGTHIPTHNEVSRMLAEHGLLGIIALLILIIAPITSKLYGRKNIYFYPLLFFWFATINHSSMRIAAPAFVYGLSLLTLTYSSKSTKQKTKPKIASRSFRK